MSNIDNEASEVSELIKTLVQEEISHLLEGQQQHLDRIKTLAEDYESQLKNLRNWRNVFISSFISIVLAVTGGIFAFDTYVKSQVSTEVSEILEALDRYTTAVNQANSDDWGSALGSLSGLWNRIESKEVSVSEKFEYNFYQNLLYVLSSMEKGADGNFQGQEHWVQLIADKRFHDYELQWEGDWAYHYNKAFGLLKFGDSQALGEIGNLLRAAYLRSESNFQRADIAYQLGLYETILGNIENAKGCFLEASIVNPSWYRVDDWEPYQGSFVNASDFQAWSRMYTLQGQGQLNVAVSEIMTSLSSETSKLDTDTVDASGKVNSPPQCVP